MLNEHAFFTQLLHENERETNKVVAVVSAAFFLLTALLLVLVRFVSSVSASFAIYYVMFPAGCVCLLFSIVAWRNNFEGSWIKHLLLIGILIACMSAYFITPWYTQYLVLVPLILSTRYYDGRLILRVSVITIVLLGVSLALNVSLDGWSENFAYLHEKLSVNIWNAPMKLIALVFVPTLLAIGYMCYYVFSLAKKLNSVARAYSEERVQAYAVESELSMASEIQSSSLPESHHVVLDGSFEIAARVNPARVVGGDFYDYYLLDETHLVVLVADVSDKGVPAALFMMSAKKALRCALECSSSFEEAVRLANRLICEDNQSEMFLTLWLASIDVRSGEGVFANAGHPFPFIKHADGSVEKIENEPNLFLGNFPECSPTVSRFQVAPGDVLLLYTDGITDAENAAGAHFGADGVCEAVRSADATAQAIGEAVMEQASAFAAGCPQFDDMTVLALQCVRIGTTHTLQIRVEASYEGTQKLIDETDSMLKQFECPDDERRKVCIILDEVGTNIAENAYACDTAEENIEKTIELEAEVKGKSIVLHIVDRGAEFNPFAQMDPQIDEEPQIGGLGIYLIKQLADEMSYERVDGCNIVSIRVTWDA